MSALSEPASAPCAQKRIETKTAVRMNCSAVERAAKASIECATFAFPLPAAAPPPMSSPASESTDSPRASTSFWSDVAHALKGEQHDYTKETLNRAILLLAVPMVLEMVMESLFAVVDVFWVGRLGADAIATVGLTESLLSLVFAVGLGLAMSTTAMVARRIGEKDHEGAAVAAVQAIVLGFLITLIVGLPCAFLAPKLLEWM